VYKAKIIVVDDEKSMREFLGIMLDREGYRVESFASAEDALEHFSADGCDVIIADLKMPGMGGLELLKKVKALSPDIVVIVITAYASVATAIDAMRAGAYNYFTKPFNIDEIKVHVARAVEWRMLERENVLLKKDLKSRYGFSNFIGTDPRMVEIYELIMSVAETKTNVLITGDSGTGKELVARAIHSEGDRKDKPFVSINCGAIPENLLETELFGHQKGAFTGAVSNKAGLVELADGGTFFLDEITELPVNLQVKILRFIQERIFRRVGGTVDKSVDIRLISATNKDIETEVRTGRFREDLFYRLNVIRINVPPLRLRKGDIPLLAKHFLDKYCTEHGKSLRGISERAMDLLVDYDYTGNVRELENAIERAVAVETGDFVTPASLPPSIREKLQAVAAPAVIQPLDGPGGSVHIPSGGIDIEKTVRDFEVAMIKEAMSMAGGVKKKAAELLGLSFRAIRYKLGKYGIQKDRDPK
jgi:two-component system response regulator PilR (NtrC family)